MGRKVLKALWMQWWLRLHLVLSPSSVVETQQRLAKITILKKSDALQHWWWRVFGTFGGQGSAWSEHIAGCIGRRVFAVTFVSDIPFDRWNDKFWLRFSSGVSSPCLGVPRFSTPV